MIDQKNYTPLIRSNKHNHRENCREMQTNTAFEIALRSGNIIIWRHSEHTTVNKAHNEQEILRFTSGNIITWRHSVHTTVNKTGNERF